MARTPDKELGSAMSAATTQDFIQSAPEMFYVPVHEAGHALAYFLLGLDFGRVSILPNKHSDGRVWGKPINYFDVLRSPKKKKHWAVISLAGEQAECLILNANVPRNDQSDDYWQLRRVATPDSVPQLRKATYRLLRKHRALLEELAEQLFLRGFMEGREVRSFLRKRLGGAR